MRSALGGGVRTYPRRALIAMLCANCGATSFQIGPVGGSVGGTWFEWFGW